MDAGSCNACSAAGTPLIRNCPLGKDFSGAPATVVPVFDQSPKWWCEPCSMMKNLQRDFRDIRNSSTNLPQGQASAPSGTRGQTTRASCVFANCGHYRHAVRRFVTLNATDVTQPIDSFRARLIVRTTVITRFQDC